MNILDVLPERAQAFRDVLADFAELPRPHSTEIRGDGTTGVRMHFLKLDEVIAWSVRFDTPLAFTEGTAAVKVATTILIDHVSVQAWTSMTHQEAFDLLQRGNQRLTREGPLFVSAAHAFSLSKLAAAG